MKVAYQPYSYPVAFGSWRAATVTCLLNALVALGLTACTSINVNSASLEELFEQVNPSVVLINTQESQLAADGTRRTVSTKGLGSGVVISRDGKILTAAHVVQASDYVEVEFVDGVTVPADVIASVVSADIALLRLLKVPEHLKAAKLGDSDVSKVGSQVFVIGAPYGLSHTLTVGHISARHPVNSMSNGLESGEFLQTDAAINKGNSGGPMFNLRGEVIGIVSHIRSESGGSEGLGFAVTAKTAKQLVLDAPSFWSGIEGYRISDELAHILNLPQSAGLLVQRVAAYSPAARIGLKGGNIPLNLSGENILLGGDIILEVNGIRIETSESYHQILRNIQSLKPKDRVRVKILRAGQVLELDALL